MTGSCQVFEALIQLLITIKIRVQVLILMLFLRELEITVTGLILNLYHGMGIMMCHGYFLRVMGELQTIEIDMIAAFGVSVAQVQIVAAPRCLSFIINQVNFI